MGKVKCDSPRGQQENDRDLASIPPCLLSSPAFFSFLSFSSLFFTLGSLFVEQWGRIKGPLSRTVFSEPQDKVTVRLKSENPRT